MVDILAIGSGLKTAYELARAAKDVDDKVRVDTAISKIMDQLTAAQFGLFEMQQQYQQLIDENRELREQISKEERFNQYRLKETQQGGFVLELKDEYVTEDNPKHAICQLCSQEGRLTPLNKDPQYYHCPRRRVATEHTYHDLPC